MACGMPWLYRARSSALSAGGGGLFGWPQILLSNKCLQRTPWVQPSVSPCRRLVGVVARASTSRNSPRVNGCQLGKYLLLQGANELATHLASRANKADAFSSGFRITHGSHHFSPNSLSGCPLLPDHHSASHRGPGRGGLMAVFYA